MSNDIPWDLLARYFANELEGEDRRQVESWIREDPNREKTVEELRELWEQSVFPVHKLDPEHAWERLSQDMDRLDRGARQLDQVLSERNIQRASSQGKQRKAQDFVRYLVITAAAAAVIIAAGLFTYSNYNATVSRNEETEIAKRELVAKEGERATYILNDGSRVILHAGSRLEVPLSFNRDERELFLEGEAYFEVTHDENKPFLVHSEHAFTRVLGTKFLVKAWADEKDEVEVVVSEGRVALGPETRSRGRVPNEVIITKNQKGRISENNDPEITGEVDMSWHMGWTEGKLTFNNRPLSEIIPKLEHWYAIDIQTENDDIDEKKLTAEIDYDQPMGEVLKGIALSLDLKVQGEGRTIRFSKDTSGKF